MNISPSFFIQNNKKQNIHSTNIDYDNCLNRVQTYIANNSNELYDNIGEQMSHKERKAILVKCINEYLQTYKPVVSEFLDENGVMQFSRLQTRLVDEIINYDILTEAMTDDEVTEIRINNGVVPGGIWIEKNGKSHDLIDSITKEPLYFKDVASVNKFINNLLKFSKITMSTTEALVNGTTIEGFRIAATDVTASARGKGELMKSPSCVIRKFSNKKMTLSDLVEKKSISSEMASFLKLLPKVDLTAVTVGSTGCGKTVMLQAILDNTPLHKRILLIQNPPEIDVSIKDENGVEQRDYVSWEAKDLKGNSTAIPTYENLMNHAMRYSPHIFVFGEIRSNNEFACSIKAANSGHYFFTTFHAEDANSAINRYTDAVLSSGGGGNGSETLVKETVCNQVKFIIVQRRLADGTRKVLSINEICGVEKDEHGNIIPKINTIFKFFPNTDGVRNENGEIQGYHAQIGTISEKTREHLALSGANKDDMTVINRKASLENPIVGTYERL